VRRVDAVERRRCRYELGYPLGALEELLSDAREVLGPPALAGGAMAQEDVAAAKDDLVADLPVGSNDHEAVRVRADVDEDDHGAVDVVARCPYY